jgi:dipeptidyl aminopeptidase/acylaminoacyl peptidase
MTEMPTWERRFRAPKLTLPYWSREAPDRVVYETNESGIWQVHALDVVSGVSRQVSDHPVGVLEGYASHDAAEVVFWQEDTGDETGRWLSGAWEGGGAEPFIAGLPLGWNEGLAQAPGVVAAGISDRDGFGIFVASDGQEARSIAHSTAWTALGGVYDGVGPDIAGLSADGSLLALQHGEHGDITHPALRIVDPRTGEVVAERGDGSFAVLASGWSPVPGDRRLAIAHEPVDRTTPAVWDLADGTWTDLDTGLEGDVEPLDWWPDGSALLLRRLDRGRNELYRFDLAGARATRLETPPGAIDAARVRPDGTVWFLHTSAQGRGRVLDDRGAVILEAGGEAPAGRPFQDWTYPNDHGQTVHGWIVEPAGDGPHPVMIYVHGGPHWLYEDRYMPPVQAYVDAGFLVAMPNYRGSTGYGKAWRDALTGDPGFTDVDDVTAGLRDVLRRSDVDPSRTVIAGWSWGGYITLMQLGRNPDLWTAGMAGVPVGDYLMAFREEAPSLQAMDLALFGGSPEEEPELYRRANPITYVDEVRAPVMFVIGEHDSRCPPGQALAYVDRLASRDHPHELYLYATGHGSLVVDEEVRQERAILDYLRARVPGLRDV